jgi:hypothetical protein
MSRLSWQEDTILKHNLQQWRTLKPDKRGQLVEYRKPNQFFFCRQITKSGNFRMDMKQCNEKKEHISMKMHIGQNTWYTYIWLLNFTVSWNIVRCYEFYDKICWHCWDAFSLHLNIKLVYDLDIRSIYQLPRYHAPVNLTLHQHPKSHILLWCI